MNELGADTKTTALAFFKDWSNYLLVTTVAALGWVASADIAFSSAWVRAVCIFSFALSIAFGILTLAIIPLVEEQRKLGHQSIYDVVVEYQLTRGWHGFCRLKSLCFPQHILFLLGVAAFALGTMGGDPSSMSSAARWSIGIVVTAGLVGAAVLIRSIWLVVGAPWTRG
jgi:hypothetical protein